MSLNLEDKPEPDAMELIAQPRNRNDLAPERATMNVVINPVLNLLQQLTSSSIVVEEDLERLEAADRQELLTFTERNKLLDALMRHNLLTSFQAAQIEAGAMAGLRLGNYRLLERLGAGGMSVVYKAEQLGLRREVAIKVMSASSTLDPRLVARFTNEMRAVAKLRHPNIVAAIDAGKQRSDNANIPPVRYFVMEYVPGKDLEQYVREQGPLPVSHVCDLMHQVASALEEARKHGLVHRDIKPSNIRITPEGQAKLVDFGIAQAWDNRHTEPGALLGTIDFMAPEQVQDAESVDIRADIYALGATMYWCLTGKLPFPANGTLLETVALRVTQRVPSVRPIRPEITAELDGIIARMSAVKREDRFQTPRAAMRALLPFINSDTVAPFTPIESSPAPATEATRPFDVLIVDDQRHIREFCTMTLRSDEIRCGEAGNGIECLETLQGKNYDVVLLDIDMPGMTGFETLKRLRSNPQFKNLKVIMFSGRACPDEMAQAMLDGADDYLTKPFSCTQLQARVRAALRLKLSMERADLLNRYLTEANRDLERGLAARNHDLTTARSAISAALSGTLLLRSTESAAHVKRVRAYSKLLAETASRMPAFAGQIDASLVDNLECCVAFHDIGMIALPDDLVMKPGRFTREERLLMQTHTTLGADLLQRISDEQGFAQDFFRMASAVARHHHERFDGSGYPGGLKGIDIPLPARIAAVADVYDALRSRRYYKPPLTHQVAMQVFMEAVQGQFDPDVIEVLKSVATGFEQIFKDSPDN